MSRLAGWALNCLYVVLFAAASPWIVWSAVRHGKHREGFAAKKLGLAAEAADAGIKAAAEKMKATGHKSRVTFYYLLAEATGTLSKLG